MPTITTMYWLLSMCRDGPALGMPIVADQSLERNQSRAEVESVNEMLQ